MYWGGGGGGVSCLSCLGESFKLEWENKQNFNILGELFPSVTAYHCLDCFLFYFHREG